MKVCKYCGEEVKKCRQLQRSGAVILHHIEAVAVGLSPLKRLLRERTEAVWSGCY